MYQPDVSAGFWSSEETCLKRALGPSILTEFYFYIYMLPSKYFRSFDPICYDLIHGNNHEHNGRMSLLDHRALPFLVNRVLTAAWLSVYCILSEFE